MVKKIKNILFWPFRKFQNFSRRGKIVTLVVLGLIVVWRINAYKNSGLEVNVQEVKFGNLIESVNVSGEVAAENSASLAFQTAGEITEVNFKEGNQVKKGDIIAKLDTTQLYYSYKSAEASLRTAQASLDSIYDQLQGHEDDETFAQKSTRTTAESTKDAAYWAFTAASRNLSGAFIKAPFDGIITMAPPNIVPGSYVSIPSSAVFRVVGPETTHFLCGVNEIDINKIVIGAKTEIEIDAYPDEVFEGEVKGFNFASSVTTTGGTAYVVRISLPENNDLKFKPGMNGDVNIIISEKSNVLLIPITSVIENEDEPYVWLSEGGKAKKRNVETGISSINEIEVISGLNTGEKIIVRPPTKIEDGSKLKISK